MSIVFITAIIQTFPRNLIRKRRLGFNDPDQCKVFNTECDNHLSKRELKKPRRMYWSRMCLKSIFSPTIILPEKPESLFLHPSGEVAQVVRAQDS
jgi:hypothetical protein